VTTYNTTERAQKIYETVANIFSWVKTSDCVTPSAVVLKQLENVDVTGTICIPGAGIGTYVLAAMQKGFSPENIYAVELDQRYYELGSSMFERFGVNYVLADFLTWNPQMQFDVVIGNPPFQNGGNSAFYTLFFKKVSTLLTEGGFFSLVSPSKAAAKFTKGYKELEKLGWNEVEYGVDAWFPNIEQPVVIYSGSTKNKQKETLTVRDGATTREVKRGTVLPVQYISPTKAFREADAQLTLSVFEKAFAKGEKIKVLFETLSEAPKEPYVYLASVAWRYHPARPKGGPYALLASVNEHDQYLNGKFMRFETVKQAEQVQWLLSRSLLYRFAAAASCRAKFVPRVLLEETPTWPGITTDEELFTKVGLTEEEINYIKLWNEVTA
jgi:phospholipid N-methyltransferase